MTSFDADLVRSWFGRLRDAEQPVMPHWGIVPTEQERFALVEGAAQVAEAVLATTSCRSPAAGDR